jgi:DNA topoisomerase IB
MPRRRRKLERAEIVTDPVESAKAAGLRYVTEGSAGIRRRRVGKSFTYLDAQGCRVSDAEILRRIRALAIPPAWTDVWICPSANGHIQAVGQDARARKQYRYLRGIAGEEFTAKDFRTWAGTVLAALALREVAAFESTAHAKRNITHAIESVARQLGNTPTISRKCYVHPAVIDAYLDGVTVSALKRRAERRIAETLTSLAPEEAMVLGLLQQRLARQAQETRKTAA